ncbi:Ectoine hydroxylase-related dioxygenase, phytanoyl-CoA dioxygenase (PhyH) family [Paenibacillus sp. UNC496MF]|uniref:phytanoyl-CoA dioxygenase family protein n=1 Tax=Paenibacillus sp. UNC496MF TaxID=1502753 RepID=UPI0008F35747|nr:phytanoyl-CoA dioxygenase family protein [Paenibacillus sp. UNC496MF]SFI29195.1 Ectoine hydroxylase-related dioxygenase, phytanoyl-CoA dioxygenase (PhyH) family [Paenibacillus sp. UNC496MF]
MNPSCLQYALTEEERKTFLETGYLIMEDALSPEQVAALTVEFDRIYDDKLKAGHDPKTALFYPNFIPDHDVFLNLVDYEKVLPKVWGILGWNIYLYHAHMIATPPNGQAKNDNTFGWHQDSGRVNQEMESHPRPRLSLKVAYFLSDVSEPDRGNFWIVPGSHLNDNLRLPADRQGQPEGAIPVRVKPGTAVFFDRRLWHAGTPNWSELQRKVLFYGYGYRWIRTKDDMTVQHLWDKSDPIRRQLLGAGVNCNGYYTPTDADVPLRVWLKEHQPELVR